MKSLLDLFLERRRTKPTFAEDENAEREMRMAELRWLLAEIAAPRSDCPAPNRDKDTEWLGSSYQCCSA